MPPSSSRRRSARLAARRRTRVAVGVALAVAVAVVAWPSHPARSADPAPSCTATAGTSTYRLTGEQAENAATIAAVGKARGLPDHAVTIALATAYQESRLLNLPYGDRDSLGLFQQRPSQGWGTRQEVTTPRIAASLFYEHLSVVPGWQALAVTDAAQRVQFSGAPHAYAQWEPQSRVMAMALTGEVPAGFACRFRPPALPVTVATAGPRLRGAIAAELGSPGPGERVSAARGWTVASWLVAHAHRYGIASVTFDGRRWTAASGAWVADPGADDRVRY